MLGLERLFDLDHLLWRELEVPVPHQTVNGSLTVRSAFFYQYALIHAADSHQHLGREIKARILQEQMDRREARFITR